MTGLGLGDRGGSGTYNLSGGLLSAANVDEYVGIYGSGSFTQSGGTNSTGFLTSVSREWEPIV